VNTGVVVNATGVWTDDVQRLADSRGEFKVRASKGIHIVVPRDRISSETGIILRTATSVLFVIPWGDYWIIGTTDDDWNYDKAHPAASRVDIDYLLRHVNEVLAVPLTHADISGVYAGLRPLLSGEHEETSQLSREHAISHAPRGMVSVAGGKYTTYRIMARDAVDAAVQDLGRHAPPCVTEHIPMVGADGYHALANQVESLSDDLELPRWRIDHLLNRYGAMLYDVLAPAKNDPTLLEPVFEVEVETPEEYMGDVIGDLSSRRGRILSMEPRGKTQIVTARVPLSTMFGYATTVRSLSQGRATYTMQFDSYKEVPNNIAEEIVEGRQGQPVPA